MYLVLRKKNHKKMTVLVDNTELSTLETARRHVTHLDRFEYQKKTSRCHKIRYRKVRTF